VVDQHAAKHDRGGREEVLLALELGRVALGELQERLVDDGGRLQRVPGRLRAHEHPRQLLEPVVDGLEQFRKGRPSVSGGRRQGTHGNHSGRSLPDTGHTAVDRHTRIPIP